MEKVYCIQTSGIKQNFPTNTCQHGQILLGKRGLFVIIHPQKNITLPGVILIKVSESCFPGDYAVNGVSRNILDEKVCNFNVSKLAFIIETPALFMQITIISLTNQQKKKSSRCFCDFDRHSKNYFPNDLHIRSLRFGDLSSGKTYLPKPTAVFMKKKK